MGMTLISALFHEQIEHKKSAVAIFRAVVKGVPIEA